MTATPARRIPKQILRRDNEDDPEMWTMSYNSARDELFLSDNRNHVVRAMRLHDTSNLLNSVYIGSLDEMSPRVDSVRYMSDSDTLLLCSREKMPDGETAVCLVLLRRDKNLWPEAHRLKLELLEISACMCCALSDSRVLVGQWRSTYLELFRVESGPRIARLNRIEVPEMYSIFSATSTCGGSSDTHVAMSHEKDQSVRVYRLRGDRLEEMARIALNEPVELLWLADRLLATEYDKDADSHAIVELEVSGGTRLERRRQLIAGSDGIFVRSWCAVKDGFAVWTQEELVHYALDASPSSNK